MNAIDIILIVYCAILMIVVIAYILSKDKESTKKIMELGRNKIPVMFGSKVYYVFSDSMPDEIIKIMGSPNSVNIDPHGNGTIEYLYNSTIFSVTHAERRAFKFSKFNLIEIA